MNFYVGITDGDWFAHLSQGERPEEVNFWQPSGSTTFRALQPGEPFLFKLHSPDDFIVGGGFFSHFSILPVSLAWKAFGTDNGAETEAEVRARIEHYRRVKPNPIEDYAIGCILLQSPFFFDRKDWIPVPGWNKSIVRGRGYDTDNEPGRSLWSRVQALIGTWQAQGEPAVAVQEPAGGLWPAPRCPSPTGARGFPGDRHRRLQPAVCCHQFARPARTGGRPHPALRAGRHPLAAERHPPASRLSYPL